MATKRRGWGEGAVYRRGDGRWTGSVELGRDHRGRRRRTLTHSGITDPVAALVLGTQPPLELLVVNGKPVVEHDTLLTVDESTLATQVGTAHARLLARAY